MEELIICGSGGGHVSGFAAGHATPMPEEILT